MWRHRQRALLTVKAIKHSAHLKVDIKVVCGVCTVFMIMKKQCVCVTMRQEEHVRERDVCPCCSSWGSCHFIMTSGSRLATSLAFPPLSCVHVSLFMYHSCSLFTLRPRKNTVFRLQPTPAIFPTRTAFVLRRSSRSPASFLPPFSCLRPLLIANNNHHVRSICCWANIKWAISAKFAFWRDVTFSWAGRAGSRARAEAVVSSRCFQTVLRLCPHVPIPAHLRCLVVFQPPPFYPGLYPPLSPPFCPALALLNPLAVAQTHKHTHTPLCYVKAVV